MGVSTLANWLVVLFMGILFYYVVVESYFFLEDMTARPQAGLNIVPIKVVDDITPLDLYSPGDVPVIIKGALNRHPLMQSNKNNPEYIAKLCGDALIDTVIYSNNYTGWAGHKDAKLMKVGKFVRDHMSKKAASSDTDELRYAHSHTFGMPLLCPVLQHDLLVPAVASKPLACHGSFRNVGQPTIFMGPAGTRSELHMDMYLLPFWLSVYFGRKKFRIILFEDSSQHFEGDFMESGRLRKTVKNPTTGQEHQVSFEVWSPNLDYFPEASKVRIYEGDVNAGDVIYVPSGALHGILNTEDSFAATTNEMFVPVLKHYIEVCVKSNFANSCDEGLDETFGNDCNTEYLRAYSMDGEKVENYVNCVINSEASRISGRDAFLQNEIFHDTYLYQTHRFPSYQQWCKQTCEEIMNDLNDMEEQELSDTDEDGELRNETPKEYKRRMAVFRLVAHWHKHQYNVCKGQCDYPSQKAVVRMR